MPTALSRLGNRTREGTGSTEQYIVPTLDVDFNNLSAGILVGVAGAVSVQDNSGATVVWPLLAAGIIHPIACRRINTAGTTATSFIVCF